MKRIIFFVGYIDILDIFVYQLDDAFKGMGYETFLFDIRDGKESLQKFVSFVQSGGATAMITFNNVGVHFEIVKGKNVWEQLQIPCINILMDHPFCYHEELASTPSNGIVLCVDRNHMNYLTRFYPNIATVGYLPHGGIELPGEKKPIKDRSIDVLYAGGLSRDQAYQIAPDYDSYAFDAKKVCDEAYEDLIVHPQKTTEQAIEEALQKNEVLVDDAQLAKLIADFHIVDLYAVSFYREKTVQTLVEAGINVTLYGYGWENCSWINKPNLSYKGRVSADEIVEQMKDAKIVLSTMTWFKDGTHDRVFNGMLQGALTASDSSKYMLEEFVGKTIDSTELDATNSSDSRDMILFELEELDQLSEIVKDMLDHPEKAQAIADRGYKKAKIAHSWVARAHELANDLLAYL